MEILFPIGIAGIVWQLVAFSIYANQGKSEKDMAAAAWYAFPAGLFVFFIFLN